MGFIIGLFFTLVTSLTTHFYLNYKFQPETTRPRNEFFETLQTFESRFSDLKFQIRGQRKTTAPVALIAIDDDSVREIGRWPWSRETMSQMTSKALELGAKSIGFDIIFSEPERGMEQNDVMMGQVVSKYSDRIVLGAFSENASKYLPYQDYCVTEAFLKNGGENLVKLNPTIIVEDETNDTLDSLDWNHFFSIIFDRVQKDRKESIFKNLEKTDETQMTFFQKNFLKSELEKSLFEYCHEWLTPQDRFLDSSSNEQIEKLYSNFLGKTDTLNKMKILEFKDYLVKNTLPHPIQQYPDWTMNIPAIQNEGLYTASFLAKLDADGYVRRYPLLYRSGNRLGSSYIPSLALQTYLLATGYRAEVKIKNQTQTQTKVVSQFTIIDPSTNPETKVADLPIDPTGQVLINYYGAEMSLPYIPAKEFFTESKNMRVQFREIDPVTQESRIKEMIVDKKEFLKDRSLLAGATAIAIYDLRNTPTAPNYPGPEIHLTMLANLFQKDFLKSHANEQYWVPILMLVLGLSLSYLLSHIGSIYSLIIILVVLGLGFVVDLFLFIYQEVEPSLLYAGILVGLIYVTITIYRYFTEERKKQQLKSTFSKYVSPAIVDELIKDPKNLQLGGRRQHMTVFFSDLRGFTTISEKLTPDELVKLLNRYLSPMTQIVFENKGTLDKYMGDAI
ncbi:MAG TPA: adenylate/guanylate cyclase domain-containing protein, partial [Pseudobdellovibrionaceae bacterium]|nr:adenylate/guanylate cyclase domain-containing protein [Pseudobdellovibrionaceae bacterium]